MDARGFIAGGAFKNDEKMLMGDGVSCCPPGLLDAFEKLELAESLPPIAGEPGVRAAMNEEAALVRGLDARTRQ
jgi:hypothetical protein